MKKQPDRSRGTFPTGSGPRPAESGWLGAGARRGTTASERVVFPAFSPLNSSAFPPLASFKVPATATAQASASSDSAAPPAENVWNKESQTVRQSPQSLHSPALDSGSGPYQPAASRHSARAVTGMEGWTKVAIKKKGGEREPNRRKNEPEPRRQVGFQPADDVDDTEAINGAARKGKRQPLLLGDLLLLKHAESTRFAMPVPYTQKLAAAAAGSVATQKKGRTDRAKMAAAASSQGLRPRLYCVLGDWILKMSS